VAKAPRKQQARPSRHALADKAALAASGVPTGDAFSRAADRAWREREANLHLFTFSLDGNPLHILRAVLLVAEGGEKLNETMLRNLRFAIEELEGPSNRNGKPSPRNAARNARILQMVHAAHGGHIPPKLDARAVADVAKQARTSEANVSMIVSRYRRGR
jgi:hypothetical protein